MYPVKRCSVAGTGDEASGAGAEAVAGAGGAWSFAGSCATRGIAAARMQKALIAGDSYRRSCHESSDGRRCSCGIAPRGDRGTKAERRQYSLSLSETAGTEGSHGIRDTRTEPPAG